MFVRTSKLATAAFPVSRVKPSLTNSKILIKSRQHSQNHLFYDPKTKDATKINFPLLEKQLKVELTFLFSDCKYVKAAYGLPKNTEVASLSKGLSTVSLSRNPTAVKDFYAVLVYKGKQVQGQ